jgi:hypothetical protein
MENVNGVTSADLVLMKRADRTLLGFVLESHLDTRELDKQSGFVCILPKGTPLTRLDASELAGHYECILGVNYVQLPAEAVQDRRVRVSSSDPKATIPQRRLRRTK